MIDFNNIIKADDGVELEITAPIYFWVAYLKNGIFYDPKYVAIKSSKEFTDLSFEGQDFSFEDAKLCETVGAYLKEIQCIEEKYNKDLDTKKKHCLMQLMPSGLNITKHVTIQNVREYFKSLNVNLNMSELTDIFLIHKIYPMEFKHYISMIKHITVLP